jgi:hypothetical protein
MYTPDRGFMRKLRELSPDLGCKFEPGHGHFVITHKRAVGEPVPILLIEGEGGGFRHPDDRDIVKLQLGDTHRVPMKDRLKQVASYMETDRERRRASAKDNIRGMTKDDRIQLSKAVSRLSNTSKNNHQYRRIDLKPRGASI